MPATVAAPAAATSTRGTVGYVSTPDAVLDRPGDVAVLGQLSPHGAALLLRGLDLRRVQLERLHELGVMGVDAFSERHDPLCAAAARIGAALEQWMHEYGRERREADDALDASWPAGPSLPKVPLTIVQLWETRLGVDYLSIACMDETPADVDEQASYARFVPVRALYDVVLSSLLDAGFDRRDL